MLGDRGLKFLPDEGAVAFQALEMDLFIVAESILPKPPEQLEPAFAQATQGAGVAVAPGLQRTAIAEGRLLAACHGANRTLLNGLLSVTSPRR